MLQRSNEHFTKEMAEAFRVMSKNFANAITRAERGRKGATDSECSEEQDSTPQPKKAR